MSVLDDTAIESFVRDGYTRLDDAFDPSTARAAAEHLLAAAGLDGHDPSTWPGPMVRVPGSTDAAVVAAINTERIDGALDQLLGPGRWERRATGYGTFPIRLPSEHDPGDAGWHIDSSIPQGDSWVVNLRSQGRAMLLLMLFTDVGPEDAPTRIRVGSHRPVARALARLGGDVAFDPKIESPEFLDLRIDRAVGRAGTVYVCHPFLVHAATWPHRGRGPRIVAQPAIHHIEGSGARAGSTTRRRRRHRRPGPCWRRSRPDRRGARSGTGLGHLPGSPRRCERCWRAPRRSGAR